MVGWAFAALFVLGLFSVGDQAGAFADSEVAFSELFGDPSNRLRDIVGSALLVLSAICLGAFVQLLSRTATSGASALVPSAWVRSAGSLTAVAILIAGGTFATVPASLAIGDFFGDPGITASQNLLPSLGYVMLVAAALSMAVTMIAIARLRSFPRWLAISTPVVAVAIVVASPSVAFLALISVWVATVATVVTRNDTP